MIGFGVNSLGNHNHPLCWSIIPHNTESQVTYSGTYKELEEASLLLFSIKSCSYPGCKCCATLHELINDARVKSSWPAMCSRPKNFLSIQRSAIRFKSQSKIPFLEMEGSGSKSIPTVVPEVENAVVPEVEMPTSSDDDYTEVLCKL